MSSTTGSSALEGGGSQKQRFRGAAAAAAAAAASHATSTTGGGGGGGGAATTTLSSSSNTSPSSTNKLLPQAPPSAGHKFFKSLQQQQQQQLHASLGGGGGSGGGAAAVGSINMSSGSKQRMVSMLHDVKRYWNKHRHNHSGHRRTGDSNHDRKGGGGGGGGSSSILPHHHHHHHSSGKSKGKHHPHRAWHVDIPKKMILSTMAVFLLLPLTLFYWKETHLPDENDLAVTEQKIVWQKAHPGGAAADAFPNWFAGQQIPPDVEDEEQDSLTPALDHENNNNPSPAGGLDALDEASLWQSGFNNASSVEDIPLPRIQSFNESETILDQEAQEAQPAAAAADGDPDAAIIGGEAEEEQSNNNYHAGVSPVESMDTPHEEELPDAAPV